MTCPLSPKVKVYSAHRSASPSGCSCQIKNTSKASLFLENMELGKTYVFRFASQGGSTGQSPWSAEVIRGAA